ncbi:hypothetical protein BGL34_05655 [Fructilactobacillus lindneri]|uniref:PnuC protein n=2 Tax=Fructilactobacillus lindneri TaxID=53444 RepID=A0A0R2JZZ8_9LACO|nr:nicotinamide riboside transporter PnuC [Fructilactobacillus lindneri]ANZ57401.1 hypothetical protein AYR60_00680 [Fructilactobacillus lindneri]ANZ58668.1 hypothetical protein AYR59_00680 [Fructilactobacillus lindneri]KRN80010.1 pnuC protein [Fructilactobacillus lindneri DSM 20690 = JCM 11027]POG97887.1 hypothetical protein BGL31_05120 [Fructilactobacillus lindneri]POG99219.1 hypothetical protein BGL32_05145 [Fructilactobacillus lindneri]
MQLELYLKQFYAGFRKTFSIKNNFHDIKSFQKSTKIILMINLLVTFITFGVSHEFSSWIGWVSLFASIFSLVNLMLCDEGKITNYSWGLLESLLFLLIDVENRLIGDLATNIYYLITQTLGIFFWGNLLSQQDQQTKINPRKLTKLQLFLLGIGLVVIYVVVIIISKKLNGTQIYLDATILPLSIVGMILMIGGYRFQWVIWIAWDIVSLIIWFRQFQSLSPASASMLALEVMKLVNGFYGAYMWFFKNKAANTD